MKTIISGILILFLATLNLQADGYKVGDKAMDFQLLNVDGSMVSLADFDDAAGFIVIFTCNHCPYSIAYEDRIIELDNKYKELGYPVIAINPNDSAIVQEDSYSNMIIRASEKGFNFPYLLDATQEVYRTYGATRTPHTFVLQKDGDDLRVAYIGAIDNNTRNADMADVHYVEDAVDALLAGNQPETTFTKAIGCSIKDKTKTKK